MKTFCFFRKNGKDLALYSKDYAAIRVMELPSCKDLGGYDEDSCGFCPVEIFVPYFKRGVFTYNDGTTLKTKQYCSKTCAETYLLKSDTEDFEFIDFGLVSGCVWGDDSDWKVQHVDIREADKGIIKLSDMFGYHPLPNLDLDMEDMIHFDDFDCKEGELEITQVTIPTYVTYRFKDGKLINTFDNYSSPEEVEKYRKEMEEKKNK